MTEFARTK